MSRLFYILSFVFIYISLIGCVSVHATAPSTPPNEDCTERLTNLPHNFGNFYHEHTEQLTEFEKKETLFWNTTGVDMAMVSARTYVCFLYLDPKASMQDITIGRIIPVYQPRKTHPIAFWTIFTGQDYTRPDKATGSGLFWGSIPYSNGYGMLRNLYAGATVEHYKLPKGRNYSADAYFKSLEEPFRSAPELQMYYYLGKPLLVARSRSGEVTNVYFQGREVPNPVERAKKYLGEKWYHP